VLVRIRNRRFVRTRQFRTRLEHRAAENSIHVCTSLAVQRFSPFTSSTTSRTLSRPGERAKPRELSTGLFVCRAGCDLEFVIANRAQHVALPQIATGFTAPAPVQNPHFSRGVNRMQRRADDFNERIFCIRRGVRPNCLCLLRGRRSEERGGKEIQWR